MNAILRSVADHFATSVAEIVSERRDRAVLWRGGQTSMYLAHRHTPHSVIEIGSARGKRGHTVMLHAIRKLGTEADSALRRREPTGSSR